MAVLIVTDARFCRMAMHGCGSYATSGQLQEMDLRRSNGANSHDNRCSLRLPRSRHELGDIEARDRIADALNFLLHPGDVQA